MTWTRKDLLALDGLTAEEITFLLDRAAALLPVVRGDVPPHDSLRHRLIANLFFEDSTRTRASFTVAAKRLGADVIDFGPAGSSRSKGESLLDTARNLRAMGIDAIVIRSSASGEPQQLAQRIDLPVINAGDGRHEHPTQGLLDLLTLRASLRTLNGAHIAIVGDLANSRVARSATHGLTTLGAHVHLIGPAALAPKTFERFGDGRAGSVSVERDFDAVLPEMDAVMMLRVQFERDAGGAIASIDDYRAGYALTISRAKRMKGGAVILHPGPINRGLELDSAVADDPERSVILDQVTHGVAVRMAVLAEVIGHRS